MRLEEMGEEEKKHEEEASRLYETLRKTYIGYEDFLKRILSDPRCKLAN